MGISPRLFCALLLVIACWPASRTFAQSSEILERTALPLIVRPAGYIFAGRVISIEYVRSHTPSALRSIQITFAAEQGVRGTRTGSRFTIRESSGLWSAGERYRVGERLLLFLYPPSRLGLTSSVGRARGRFAIDRNGRVVLPPATSIPSSREGGDARIPLHEFRRSIRRAESQEK